MARSKRREPRYLNAIRFKIEVDIGPALSMRMNMKNSGDRSFRPVRLLVAPKLVNKFRLEEIRIQISDDLWLSKPEIEARIGKEGVTLEGLPRLMAKQPVAIIVTNISPKAELFEGSLLGE